MADDAAAPAGTKTRKAPKPKSIYHLFTEEEGGVLSPIGKFEGRNAEDAVATYLGGNGGAESSSEPFVIVPDRNLSRVRAQVETVSKVKLSAA